MAATFVSTAPQEKPLYRVIYAPGEKGLGERQTRSDLAPRGDVSVVGCNLLYVGDELEYPGWPPVTLEPINAGAKVIAGFAKSNASLGFGPKTPRDERSGRWFVPAHVKAHYLPREKWPAPKAIEASPDMPSYRLAKAVTLGGREYAEGTEITYLFWPSPEMQPLNEMAEQVVEYYAAHRDNFLNLPDSPWNAYDKTLWLPMIAGATAPLYGRPGWVDPAATSRPSFDRETERKLAGLNFQ